MIIAQRSRPGNWEVCDIYRYLPVITCAQQSWERSTYRLSEKTVIKQRKSYNLLMFRESPEKLRKDVGQ